MKTEITDYLYKNKEIPYWEDEVISLVNNIIKDHDQELLIEIEKIIDDFYEAVEAKIIPLFVPREKWQADIKYNNFPEFVGLNAEELKEKYKLLTK